MFSRLKTSFSELFSKFSSGDKPPSHSPHSPPLTFLTSQTSTLQGILDLASENPDEILKRKGVKVYDEMEAKDPHLYSVYQTRKLAVSRIPWEIIPASKNKKDQEIANFVFAAIDDARGIFSEDIFQLMDAVGKGFSVLEKIWKVIDSGKWEGKYSIEELVFHPQRFWKFADRKNTGKQKSEIFFKTDSFNLKPVPWSKVIHFAYDSQDSMYGRAAFKACYWHYFFKKESWKWWIQYLEKYAGPTAVGKYPSGSSKSEQDALLALLESIQQETAVTYPDQFDVSFLEASRAGAVSYRDMSDACNAEISKAILGATQNVEEGRRGSYSLSRAHSQVRNERVEADGIQIADIIQQQLVKALVDFNFITTSYPQFVMHMPVDSVDSRKKTKNTINLPGYYKHAEKSD